MCVYITYIYIYIYIYVSEYDYYYYYYYYISNSINILDDLEILQKSKKSPVVISADCDIYFL